MILLQSSLASKVRGDANMQNIVLEVGVPAWLKTTDGEEAEAFV
jgi:hypothetical protein